MNMMLDAFGDKYWTLTIDAGEQFIYPHYEERKLSAFCRYLDDAKAQAVFCLLLDMYSDRLGRGDGARSEGGAPRHLPLFRRR